MSKDMTAALRALMDSEVGYSTRQDKKLPESRQSPNIPPRTGRSGPVAQKAAQKTAGIASPLTEDAYAARTFWPVKTMTSTDGVFQIAHKPLKSVTLKDANGAEVVLNFKAPE